MNDQTSLPQPLLAALRKLIAQGRQRALRAVDMVQGRPAGKSAGISSP